MKSCATGAAIFLAAVGFGYPLPGSRGSDASVLLFTIDSCRADRINENITPHIHAWSRTGTRFENAYSVSAWTAPGVVSILTGLYPATHQVDNRDHMGSPDLVTLPKIFQERGYEVPNLNFFTFAPYYRNLGLPDIQREYFGENPGDELLNWLEKHEDKPFFLWYHTTLVHQPYNPRPEDLFAPREELYKSAGIRAVMTGAIVPFGSTEFQPEDGPVLDRLYNTEVARVDHLFKRVLDLLKSKGLLENTLVILSADHGEELLDHGFVGHASTSLQATLYQEVVRIPLMLSWPGQVPSGRIVAEPVNQTDVFPTILGLFGMEIPEYLQGQNLLGRISGKRPLFFESVIAGNQTTADREHIWLRGILKENHKYMEASQSPGQPVSASAGQGVKDLPFVPTDLTNLPALYNFKSDPDEKTNLIDKKAGLAQSLNRELQTWRRQVTSLRTVLFPARPQVYSSPEEGCPVIYTPENGKTLDHDVHTGMVLFDWSGDKETTYLLEYDIGRGNYHVAGTYEVKGNHHWLGPLPRELWENLKAWNPFKFRVSPKLSTPCWSEWVTFHF